MEKRKEELKALREYIENIDQETTLLLQNLQWDSKHILQSNAMTACKYDNKHRIPISSKDIHEQKCYLKHEGYSSDAVLLPDPVDADANTVVKLSKQDIIQIINKASSMNPTFKRVTSGYILPLLFNVIFQGIASRGAEPLTAERLQQVYTADERRALHDAVVEAAPFCHDLADLALSSSKSESQSSKAKSRAEILAELRDMKRRRAKYRVTAKTSNYSHVLRDVIKTQMELYAEAKGITIKTEYGEKSYINQSEIPQSDKIAPTVEAKQEDILPDDGRRERKRDKSYDSQRSRRDNGESRDHDYRHAPDRDKKRNDRFDRRDTKDRRRSEGDRSKYDRPRLEKHKLETKRDRNKSDSRNGHRYDEYNNKYGKYDRRRGGNSSMDKQIYGHSDVRGTSSSSKKRKHENTNAERTRPDYKRYYAYEK